MFLGERIRQAREIRGLTQEELASKLGRTKGTVAQAEGGFLLPNQPLIESIALATRFPLSFFDSEPHSEFPIAEILLRARRDIKRRDVLDTVRFAEHVYAIYSTLSDKVKPIPVTIPNKPGDPIEAARATREALGINGDGPIPDLIHRIERAGVCVLMLSPLEGREAFCVWMKSNGRDLPVIAAAVPPGSGDRYRLSVAHELGHLVLHRSFLRKSNSEVEEEAFGFAAELLMPESGIKRELLPPFNLTAFARLKPRWGVSIAALVRRAHELSIITTRQYKYLFQQIGAAGMKTREPKNLDIPVERPRLLRKLAELTYGDPIDYNKLSAETSISAQELRKLISDYRGKGTGSEEKAMSPKVLSFPSRQRHELRTQSS